MGWVGLGQLFGGSGWAGSMKIDPRTTLRHTAREVNPVGQHGAWGLAAPATAKLARDRKGVENAYIYILKMFLKCLSHSVTDSNDFSRAHN